LDKLPTLTKERQGGKMYKGYISVLSILALSSVLFTACGEKEQIVEQVIRPVRYIQVYTTGGDRVRSFSGIAKSGVEANLSFRVAGTIDNVRVKVGDKVRGGQLLISLDARDYELQVQQAEASLSQARAQLQKADADYERVRSLYENNNASKSDLDAMRAAYESSEAAQKASEKTLELAKLQLSYTKLRAPSAGLIASVDVEVNENVAVGNPVVMLTSGSDIEVEVTIPEILISQINQGDRVQVSFDAQPGKNYSGVVSEVGVAAVGFATTYPATVKLTNASPDIRSGMAAEVAFNFKSTSNKESIIVPSIAVGEDRNGRFVFVVEPANGDTAIVKKVEVTTGEILSDGMEIFSGLTDGDLVVTAGVSKIISGQKVKL